MKSVKVLVIPLLLLTVMGAALCVSAVQACEPEEGPTAGKCVVTRRARVVAVAPTPTVMVAMAIPAKPRWDGPATALTTDDGWHTLAGGATIWYQIGFGPNPQHLDVWMDVNRKEGINFSVFAPEQMGDWSPATKPKGQGAYNRAEPEYDLRWSGQAAAGGTWYVVVKNTTASDLTYRLGHTRVETPRKSCNGLPESFQGWSGVWQLCQ